MSKKLEIYLKNSDGELLQSGKGNKLLGSPGSSESPKQGGPKKHTPRHIIITLPKIQDKERILKAAREKDTVTYKGVPIRGSADFSKRNLAGKKGLETSIQSQERQGPTSKITLSSKAII